MWRLGGIRALATLGGLILVGMAQGEAQTKQEKYAELLMIQELINDPDPLMRLLNFEEIVAGGDRLKTELAIRTAMGIEDRRLRSVAMLAYLRTVELIAFDWQLPGEIAAMVAKDADKLTRPMTYVYEDHTGAGGKMPVLFENISEDGSFSVYAMMRLQEKEENFSGKGHVLGDRLAFRTPVRTARSSTPICNFDIIPTAQLELRGSVSCEGYNWGGPMIVSAPMF